MEPRTNQSGSLIAGALAAFRRPAFTSGRFGSGAGVVPGTTQGVVMGSGYDLSEHYRRHRRPRPAWEGRKPHQKSLGGLPARHRMLSSLRIHVSARQG